MPRKMHCFCLVLALTLLAGLVGQAAQALPVVPRATFTDTTAGDFFTAIWSWIADNLVGLGHPVATAAQQSPSSRVKDTGASDPNGHAACHLTLPPGQKP
jgi:hypothetical protein